MISTVCTQKMFSERRPTASRKCTMGPWPRLSRMNSRMKSKPAAPSRKMLSGPSDHSASEMAVGGAGSKSAYGNECCGGQQPGKDFGRQGLVQQMLLFGKEADIEVGHHHGTLDQAEGQFPHKARAPAQQDAACHSPWNIALREDVQDHIQQHPAYHQRQQIPHRPAGEELLPEILGRVGQAQQKAAGDLDRLADGAGQVLERLIMNDKVQHAGEQRRVSIGFEQAFELLVDALVIERLRKP